MTKPFRFDILKTIEHFSMKKNIVPSHNSTLIIIFAGKKLLLAYITSYDKRTVNPLNGIRL